MEAKRGVFALLFVAIMVCSAMAMAMAAPGEDAGTSVNHVEPKKQSTTPTFQELSRGLCRISQKNPELQTNER
ncbi:hypothetical protein C5S53_04665 [Methanophagales archaeon]|nr:hypothetical protein C5S53_04665 [Methanophagales archaeon]